MRILLLFLLGALLGVERAPTPALIHAPGPLQLSPEIAHGPPARARGPPGARPPGLTAIIRAGHVARSCPIRPRSCPHPTYHVPVDTLDHALPSGHLEGRILELAPLLCHTHSQEAGGSAIATFGDRKSRSSCDR